MFELSGTHEMHTVVVVVVVVVSHIQRIGCQPEKTTLSLGHHPTEGGCAGGD